MTYHSPEAVISFAASAHSKERQMLHETAAEKPQCPQCGSTGQVIPIVYGKPTRELLEQWAAYEVALGAFIKINGRQPPWTCTKCNVLIEPDESGSE